MVRSYYLDRDSRGSGRHELHVRGCVLMPAVPHCIDLGFYANCHAALQAAEVHFDRVAFCELCCRPCEDKAQ